MVSAPSTVMMISWPISRPTGLIDEAALDLVLALNQGNCCCAADGIGWPFSAYVPPEIDAKRSSGPRRTAREATQKTNIASSATSRTDTERILVNSERTAPGELAGPKRYARPRRRPAVVSYYRSIARPLSRRYRIDGS